MVKINNNFVLALILVAAALVRYWGIGFGLPNTQCRPDESMVVSIISSPLNYFRPFSFNYPSFFKYLSFIFYGLYYLFGLFIGRYRHVSNFIAEVIVSPKNLYLISRLLSATFGTATVFICYKIAERLFDKKTAIIAAFFLSFAYLHVRDSHFGTVDVTQAFFVMSAMFFIIKSYEDSSTRNYIFAGILTGLATSTKYVGVLLTLPMLIVDILSASLARSKAMALFFNKRMFFFIIFLTVTFLITTPYAVLDFTHFLKDCLYEMEHLSSGHAGIILGRGWWYHLRFSLLYGMGFSLLFASVAGALLLVKINFKKMAILCSFPFIYYVVAGKGFTVFLRYIIPVIPFLCITAAVFTVYIINFLKEYLRPGVHKFTMFMLPFLIILPSVYNVLFFDTLISKKDNRLIASEWIHKNLPEGSFIAHFGSSHSKIQLNPTFESLKNRYLNNENRLSYKIYRNYLIKNAIKGFNETDYDIKSKKFNFGRKIIDLPRYIIVEESPLKYRGKISPEQKEIIQKSYHLLKGFKAINIYNVSNWFDQCDAFYVPFVGFEEVQRPGPNIYVYEKS